MSTNIEPPCQTGIAAWDRRLAAPMFFASCLSLVFLAGVLHLHEHVDDRYVFFGSLIGLAAVYPLFWFEAVVRWRQWSPLRWWSLLYCLLPPLRLVARDHATGQQVWLPEIGWKTVDRELRSRIESELNTPILVVSVLVLPLILVEYIWKETITSDPFWARWIAIATALVWLAFAAEFILMASIAEKKLVYCKQHWLDLVIILLPLLAFLRALRLGRLLRLTSLTNSSRVYRLKGVAMRTYRALLVIKAIDNLINGSPGRRLVRLRQRLEEQETVLEDIRAEIRKLEAQQIAEAPPASAA